MPDVKIAGVPKTRLTDSGHLELVATLIGVPDDLWAGQYRRFLEARIEQFHMRVSDVSRDEVAVVMPEPVQAEGALAAIVEEIALANARWDEAQKRYAEFQQRVEQWWSQNGPR